MAFVTGDYDVRPLEVWAMENFLRWTERAVWLVAPHAPCPDRGEAPVTRRVNERMPTPWLETDERGSRA
jgi:hypothetical protein